MVVRALSLFPTMVLIDHSENAGILNPLLADVIQRKMATDRGIQASNVASWHSERDMAHWGGEATKALVGHVMTLADKHTRDIAVMPGGGARHRWHAELWANVTQSGGANASHAHPGAFWSAVYYVDDGYQGSEDSALGGELRLYDPRFPANRMRAPDLRFTDAVEDELMHAIRPQSGMLIMFPSWLNHAVAPYQGKAQRISIAINLVDIPR